MSLFRYSRKIIWLKVLRTNNDPNVILLYYLLATLSLNGTCLKIFIPFVMIESYKGCPCIMRSDHGTENTSLSACHMALRHYHEDEFSGEKSYRYGSSTTNTVKTIVICM